MYSGRADKTRFAIICKNIVSIVDIREVNEYKSIVHKLYA